MLCLQRLQNFFLGEQAYKERKGLVLEVPTCFLESGEETEAGAVRKAEIQAETYSYRCMGCSKSPDCR